MADNPETPDQPADTPDEPSSLGDAGKKALDQERKARRDAEKQAKELADRLQAIEDKDKSEVERLTGQIKTLTDERDAAVQRADRLEVAVVKSLDEDRATRITSAAKRLTGTTREELEADADEFLTAFASPDLGSSPAPGGRPVENLHPGSGDPTTEPEPDIAAVVADIPRGL